MCSNWSKHFRIPEMNSSLCIFLFQNQELYSPHNPGDRRGREKKRSNCTDACILSPKGVSCDCTASKPGLLILWEESGRISQDAFRIPVTSTPPHMSYYTANYRHASSPLGPKVNLPTHRIRFRR